MSAAPLRSVLYVDDEPDIREIVSIALGLAGTLTVHTTDGGELALQLARSLRPDLVLLDVMMPGLDGPSTLGRMRADPLTAAIPVVFMTAKAMPKEVALLREMGAAGVIAKPFDPMQLSTQVLRLWQACGAEAKIKLENALELDMRQRLTQFGERFLQRTKDEVMRLRNLVEHIHSGDEGVMAELEQLAHRIRGSGSTFGFVALSECAEDFQHLLEALRQEGSWADTVFDIPTRLRLSECTQRLALELETAVLSQRRERLRQPGENGLYDMRLGHA
jgi:CheY-like chemotaxis protein